jgi:protein-tyrosine phosphatase
MREIAAQLWIGNALEARNLSTVLNAGIEAIVDLAIEEPPISATRELVCCRIPILDGAGNPPARIRLAVETICRLVSSEVPTLVVCSAGMSRSTSRLNSISSATETSPNPPLA